MAWGKGYKGQILLDWETTYGADPSGTTSYKIPFNTCDLGEDVANQHAATIRNNRNPTQPFRGNRDANGTIVVPYDIASIGLWLKALLGSPTTTGSISPYTHNYDTTNVPPSFLLDKGHTDLTLYYKYNGMKVNTFATTFGGDGELIATIGLIGAKETKGTSAYEASPTVDMSAMTGGRFENHDASLEEGGVAIDYVTEMGMEISNGLTPAYCIGDSGIKSELAEGMLTMTGTLIALFQNDTLLLKGRTPTESSLSLTLTSGSYSLNIEFDEVQFSQRVPAINGPEGILLNLTWEAYYQDGASGHGITATLINTTSAYT